MRRRDAAAANPDSRGAPAPRRLPPLLRRAWFSLNQAFRRRIAHLALTPDQYTVLRTLAEAEPAGLNQRELTQVMSSDPNTIASLLERMEANGWLARHADPADRRVRRVQLQPPGRRQFEEARAVAQSLQTEVLSCLSPRQRDAFLARLERVADACRAAAEASPRATDFTASHDRS